MHHRLQNTLRPFGDPVFWGVLLLGFGAYVLPEPGIDLDWEILLFKALVEELVFRFGLQEMLARMFREKRILPGLSAANLAASSAFAAVHFINQPPLWALAVFPPSLVFGWLWDRYRNILPCWLVHFFYNYCFFHRLS